MSNQIFFSPITSFLSFAGLPAVAQIMFAIQPVTKRTELMFNGAVVCVNQSYDL